MELIEATKLKGSPVQVLDCSRDNLPSFCLKMGYRVGAEIGVYKGEFTEKFLKAGLRMYAIDPWVAFHGQGKTQAIQARQNFLFGHAQRFLASYGDRCQIIRATSMEALRYFEDGSLDFVYIDGDHSFRYIAEDLFEWTKKVRKGGMVSGHDYFCTDPIAKNIVCHVGGIVEAYTKVFNINNWYVFGRSKPLEREAKDDKYLSWMWIK